MAEQGLKAIVYPEIDEQGLQNFVKKLNEQLGGAFINVRTSDEGDQASGQAPPTTPTTSPGGAPTTPAQVPPDEENKPLDVKETAEAIKEGHKEAEEELSKDEDVTEAKNAPTKKGLGDVIGSLGAVGTSLMAGGVSIGGYLEKVWKFIEGSSPALKTVMGLFEQAFQLVWMPIGTIIAKELMPVLSDVMQTVATWMGRAWDIYDQEGWAGLLTEVFAVSIEVLWKYLSGLGAVLWPALEALGTMVLDFIFEQVLGITGGLDTVVSILTPAYDALVGLWNVIEGPLMGVADAIWGALQFVHGVISVISNFLIQDVSIRLQTVASTLTTAVNVLTDVWGALSNTVGGALSTISGILTQIWDVLKGSLTAVGDAIWTGLQGIYQGISFINNYLLNSFGDTFNSMAESVANGVNILGEVWRVLSETVGKVLSNIWEILNGIWETLTGTVGGAINTAVEFAKDPVGATSNFVTSSISNAVNTVKNVLPFLAEGGVVTEPTLGVFGEAGPEAVIPLNQLNQVANQYTTDASVSERIGGNNVMNFYITGTNANEISGEVQRILEKTVGKASSKMMWW